MTIPENTFQTNFLAAYIFITTVPSLLIIGISHAFGSKSANISYKITSIIHPFPSTYESRPSHQLHCFQALQSASKPNVFPPEWWRHSRGIMTPEPPQSALEHQGAVTQLHTQTSTQLMNESVIYNQKPTLTISVLTDRSDLSSRSVSALV